MSNLFSQLRVLKKIEGSSDSDSVIDFSVPNTINIIGTLLSNGLPVEAGTGDAIKLQNIQLTTIPGRTDMTGTLVVDGINTQSITATNLSENINGNKTSVILGTNTYTASSHVVNGDYESDINIKDNGLLVYDSSAGPITREACIHSICNSADVPLKLETRSGGGIPYSVEVLPYNGQEIKGSFRMKGRSSNTKCDMILWDSGSGGSYRNLGKLKFNVLDEVENVDEVLLLEASSATTEPKATINSVLNIKNSTAANTMTISSLPAGSNAIQSSTNLDETITGDKTTVATNITENIGANKVENIAANKVENITANHVLNSNTSVEIHRMSKTINTPNFDVNSKLLVNTNINANLPVVSNQTTFNDDHLITQLNAKQSYAGRVTETRDPLVSDVYISNTLWTNTVNNKAFISTNPGVWTEFTWNQSLDNTDDVKFNQVDTQKIINVDDLGVVRITGDSVRLGYDTGIINTPTPTSNGNGIAIGYQACYRGMPDDSIYIGVQAGSNFSNTHSGNTVIGNYNGTGGLNDNNTLIGHLTSSNADNVVALNSGLSALQANKTGFFVKPVDSLTARSNMRYSPVTGEITYNPNRFLILEDEGVSNQTRVLGQGFLYKKPGDPALYWLPDTGGAEVDLTHQALYNRVAALEQLIRDNNGTTEIRAPVDFTTF